eukprot:jgi/Botrbrau1/10982/Bobra.0234s0007.1
MFRPPSKSSIWQAIKGQIIPISQTITDNEAECLSRSLHHRQPRFVPHSCTRSVSGVSIVLSSQNGTEKVVADI